MRVLELDNVFVVNGRLAIKLITFAKLLHYSDIYLLQLIKKLLKKGIKIAFKWKKNWYIFLPTTPIKSIIQNKSNSDGGEVAITPSGNSINTNWDAAVNELPLAVNTALGRTNFTITVINNRLVIPTPSSVTLSSTLIPKNGTQFIPPNLGLFPAMTDYKYGYYIYYDENKMSTFDPGTAGSLKSTQIPQAFFEVCRALDAAENSRNGANPGLPPRRNLSTTVSFDTGTIAVAATVPIVTSIQSDGTIKIVASDYLGSTYSAFTNGSGDLTSTNMVAAFLEIASLLSASEKAVTPAENQPNNIQIQVDVEAGSAVVSANLPFTTASATNGDVTIQAIDYL
ncbi:hypothetical protein [Halotia branconii]|uniref:Uncharacterized protein n=1 Tax=Halotia branconii CENA392 TaxID=1539056 RepID=A0AAJ6P746_9CYAN|nr:hypothetical protein [Halotia branconii]WGV23369.1 hypothetical protein QI031_16205 [Halotia branconii CENA392]